MKLLKPANWVRSALSFCLFLCEVETKCGLGFLFGWEQKKTPTTEKKKALFILLPRLLLEF